MLVYKQIQGNEDPKEVLLNEIDIWVQVYDIPKGCVSEIILQSIANHVGCFVKTDPANFNGPWKSYYRVRVRMDVYKPLKRRMRIKWEGGQWSWVNFKYERLGTFCFVCGKIGHSDRDCSVVYANMGREVERAYGTWLRAPNKNSKPEIGSRWLRNVEGSNNREETGENLNMAAKGATMGANEAKFQESETSVAKNQEEFGQITITTRNLGVTGLGGKIQKKQICWERLAGRGVM